LSKRLDALFKKQYEIDTEEIMAHFNDYLLPTLSVEEYDGRIAVLKKLLKKIAFFNRKDRKWFFKD
jgi:uncharacterized small protein (DUF1192 family)